MKWMQGDLDKQTAGANGLGQGCNMPDVLEGPVMEQNEEGESSGNKVRFMPRGQVVRYKDGNWEMAQKAGPAIVCDGGSSGQGGTVRW